jgi:hypothetical protein
MIKQKQAQVLGDKELDDLIIEAGKNLGLLPAITAEEVLNSNPAPKDDPVPEWLQNPAEIACLLVGDAQRRIRKHSQENFSDHSGLAMAARAGTGKLSPEVLEKMNADRAAAESAANRRKSKPNGS